MESYSSISVRPEDMKKFKQLRKKTMYNALAFFRYLLGLFSKTHCPECGAPMNIQVKKSCSCKDSERM